MKNFNVKKMKDGYVKFCSRECMYSSEEWKCSVKDGFKDIYGVDNVFRLQSFKDKNYSKNEEIQLKKYQTRKRNHTFKASKQEDYVYELLIGKFGIENVIRQYRTDERYRFNCDFYIKSEDTFIEYNGNWTHGGHPFNDTNENDLKILQKWKSSPLKYYENAIETWTIRDVNKRTVARNNNLKYVELWNIEDAKRYVGL